MLKGQWTEESAQRAAHFLAETCHVQSGVIDLVGAQDDSMAMGVRQAFPKITNEEEHLCNVIIPAYSHPPTGVCDSPPRPMTSVPSAFQLVNHAENGGVAGHIHNKVDFLCRKEFLIIGGCGQTKFAREHQSRCSFVLSATPMILTLGCL